MIAVWEPMEAHVVQWFFNGWLDRLSGGTLVVLWLGSLAQNWVDNFDRDLGRDMKKVKRIVRSRFGLGCGRQLLVPPLAKE